MAKNSSLSAFQPAEFGIVAGVGRNGLGKRLEGIADARDEHVPPEARGCLRALRDQLALVKEQILEADRRILAWHRASELSRRLDDIPGVGPLIATALWGQRSDSRDKVFGSM